MLIDNRTTRSARAWPTTLADGSEVLVVAVKAAFEQPLGSTTWRAGRLPTWIEADVFTGDPAVSAPLLETDFTPPKPACDVIIIGHAHPLAADPYATRCIAGLRCGPIDKAWAVVGERTWQRRLFGWRTSEPTPLIRVPLHYGSAFGGIDLLHPDHTRRRMHQGNPSGCGFFGDAPKELITGQVLSAFEAIEDPPRSPEVEHRAVAAGVIGRGWLPRRVLAGTYDEAWQEECAPFLPADFSPGYFNSVPPDQQMPFPVGGEEMDLANLTADGWWSFALPTLNEDVEIFPIRGESLSATLVVDTVVVEADARRVTLTARAAIALPGEIEEIERVVVGPVSAGWRTARRLGKRWRPHTATPAGAAP